MEEFEKLARMVEVGVLTSPVFLGGQTLEEVLDERDEPAFDDEWVRAHELVASSGGDALDFADEEETLFLRVYEVFESSDLAACIAEDIGLLACASGVGIEDAWLTALRSSYAAGRFPRGQLRSK